MKKIFATLLIILWFVIFANAIKDDYQSVISDTYSAINRARTKPEGYVKLIDHLLKNNVVQSEGSSDFYICGESVSPKVGDTWLTGWSMLEGGQEWIEGRDFLASKNSKGKSLKWSKGLAQACYDHVRDTGPNGIGGDIGTDDSTPETRAKRYVESSNIEEIISYGDTYSPTLTVAAQLVDSGDLNRHTRKSIFNKHFTHIGVSCGCHSEAGNVCCMLFGEDVEEKDSSLSVDIPPQLKECTPYSPDTKGINSDSPKDIWKSFVTKIFGKPFASHTSPNSALQQGPITVKDFEEIFPGLYEQGNGVGNANLNQPISNFLRKSKKLEGERANRDWAWNTNSYIGRNWKSGSLDERESEASGR